MNTRVSVHSLLKMIDPILLEKIAIDTRVNYKAKKLTGEVVFKLLMMSILDNTKVSLRIMERIFSKSIFKAYTGISNEETIRFSSLSERLSVIKSSFFEQLFTYVFDIAKKHYDKELDNFNLRKYDSTIVSLSNKLLKKGMVNGQKSKDGTHRKHQIKFTVSLFNNLPSDIVFYNEQKYLGEDLTLGNSILKTCIKDNDIVVFDRGLKKRVTFKAFNDKAIYFVTRINPTKSIKILENYALDANAETETLRLLSDRKVYLYHKGKTLLKEAFRLVEATSKSNKKSLFFLTNIKDLSAKEITEIYRKRWDIEVFFKFIKQHLHFKHLLNRSENGIKVMMYVTMTVAILLLLYKKLNKIKSYKIAKYDFVEELNMEIIKEIVVICDGDINKYEEFNSS